MRPILLLPWGGKDTSPSHFPQKGKPSIYKASFFRVLLVCVRTNAAIYYAVQARPAEPFERVSDTTAVQQSFNCQLTKIIYHCIVNRFQFN